MTTTLVGTAYRIDGVELGPNDTITAGTSLTAVEFQSIDPDSNDFVVTPPSVIFEGTVNETVLSEAEEITFLADGAVIATESPTYEFVNLNTDVGEVFGITFSADGDTYFLPFSDQSFDGLSQVTEDSQIQANDVAFNQLDFGLLPPGSTSFEGQVFGSGAIDAPGLGETRVVIDSDDTPFNPGESTEINPFNAEVLVTVTFADGSSISGVEAYQTGDVSFVNNQSIDTRAYAIDVAAVEAAGYALEDVTNAEFESFTQHDLTYAEVGFEAGDTAPGDAPDPTPGPVVELIEGTDGADSLTGTDADEVLIGGAGNDLLTGGDGADTFIFGADSSNGTRERDVITDFNTTEDVLALEADAEILRVVERGDDVRIVLDGGDRDSILIRDADAGIVDNIVFASEDFLI